MWLCRGQRNLSIAFERRLGGQGEVYERWGVQRYICYGCLWVIVFLSPNLNADFPCFALLRLLGVPGILKARVHATLSALCLLLWARTEIKLIATEPLTVAVTLLGFSSLLQPLLLTSFLTSIKSLLLPDEAVLDRMGTRTLSGTIETFLSISTIAMRRWPEQISSSFANPRQHAGFAEAMLARVALFDASLKAAILACEEVAICVTIVFLELVHVGVSLNAVVAHRLAIFVQDATGGTAILTALEVAVLSLPLVPDSSGTPPWSLTSCTGLFLRDMVWTCLSGL
ncbi:hypothetical protein KC327_g47 [Hortaea werneckii]|nr:hypothetical protein KC327_g47 [Hortaea werneckii]